MSDKFRKLDVWQRAKTLAIEIYSLTDGYPIKENFGLTSQTNRAAVSIAANIAEGSSRSSRKDFAHFLEIAIGSAFELQTLLEIAFNREYIEDDSYNNAKDNLEELAKMLFGLKRKILPTTNC